MTFPEYFRQLREESGQSYDSLANLAGIHRNTIINLEQNRSVKFKTVALLLQIMGHDENSEVTRRAALLWLEGVSGIHFSLKEVIREKKKMDRDYRKSKKSSIDILTTSISEKNLSEAEVGFLLATVENEELMNILKSAVAFAKV